MKTIIVNENPYAELFTKFFNQQFPEISSPNDKELLDILTSIIIGNKNIRYGCLPNPEHLVHLRKIIKKAIDSGTPIPILVPWGGVKANLTDSVDIAEVSAIRRLLSLSSQIKKYYPIGIHISLRIEDESGYDLFKLEGDMNIIKRNIDSYSNKFVTLIKILDTDNSVIDPIKETDMDNASLFASEAKKYAGIIESYLMASVHIDTSNPKDIESLPEYKKLLEAGWKGYIPYEQREHYLNAYRRIYNDWDQEKHLKRLSFYFGGSLARHKLGMIGNKSYWDDFIQLAFIPPIKGLPEGYNHNYVYYRTLPMNKARTHIPAWRAKGYFKISGYDMCSKLASFNDTEIMQSLIPAKVKLCNNGMEVKIDADYCIEY